MHAQLFVDGDCRLSQNPLTGQITLDVPAVSVWLEDHETGGGADAVEAVLAEDAKSRHPGLSDILKDPKHKGLPPNERVAAILVAALKHKDGKAWAASRRVKTHPAGQPVDLGRFGKPEVVVP